MIAKLSRTRVMDQREKAIIEARSYITKWIIGIFTIFEGTSAARMTCA